MFNRLFFISFIVFSILATPKAEASFPFNVPAFSVSFKPCFAYGEVFAVAPDWGYCPSWFEVHMNQSPEITYSKQLFKVCKHNTEVYDVRNNGGTCHFEDGAGTPNQKLRRVHEKVDGGHDCDLDEDEDNLYIGQGGVVM